MHKIYALFISLLMVLAVATAGQACCFYNHTSNQAQIDGPKVGNWIVKAHSHRCTDGVGGIYEVELVQPYFHQAISTSVTMPVDDHGWLTIAAEEDDKWKVRSKDKNGNVKHTKYMYPTWGPGKSAK